MADTSGSGSGSTPSPYQITLSLSVIDDLGLNLYSSIPAVLSEAVANAWDADALRCDISIDLAEKTITIEDDGLGMTRDDANEKYLTVGYRRREAGSPTTVSGRHVMGRKGIGKLSLFAIAKTVTVFSVRDPSDGSPPSDEVGFRMDREQIRAQARAGRTYYPTPVEQPADALGKGTRIVLSELSVTPTAATLSALQKRVARRFSILGDRHSFHVSINGQRIGVADRGYFPQLQYLWSIGDVEDEYETLATRSEKKTRISGLVDGDREYTVSGWVGTFHEQRDMNVDEGDNSVAVLAWGKLLHEDLMAQIKAGGLYTKYLIGELRADFLDVDDQVDIVTSGRQSVKEGDPRVGVLTSWFMTNVLNAVERSWGQWRKDTALDKALAIEAIKDWHATLSTDNKRFAKELFAKIGTLEFEEEDDRSELYRNAILAFEKLKLRESLSSIEELPDNADFSVVRSVFDGIDELEAVAYHGIVEGRLEVIRTFTGLVDAAEKEKVIQKYLFDHLWLLHPSWERATTNARMEESVTKEFNAVTAGLSADEKRGRIDIRYRTAAGKHVIIELKKSNVSVNIDTLMGQLRKYRAALEKCLDRAGEKGLPIETIAVLGRQPSGPGVTAESADQTLLTINARYVTYERLIGEALDSYQAYAEADERLSKLSEILSRV